MLYWNTPPSSISNLIMYPLSALGTKIIFVTGLIRFNRESIGGRFLHLPLLKVSGQLPRTRINKIETTYVTKKCEYIWSESESENMSSHFVWDTKPKITFRLKIFGIFKVSWLEKVIKPVDGIFVSSITGLSFQLHNRYSDMMIFI